MYFKEYLSIITINDLSTLQECLVVEIKSLVKFGFLLVFLAFQVNTMASLF